MTYFFNLIHYTDSYDGSDTLPMNRTIPLSSSCITNRVSVHVDSFLGVFCNLCQVIQFLVFPVITHEKKFAMHRLLCPYAAPYFSVHDYLARDAALFVGGIFGFSTNRNRHLLPALLILPMNFSNIGSSEYLATILSMHDCQQGRCVVPERARAFPACPSGIIIDHEQVLQDVARAWAVGIAVADVPGLTYYVRPATLDAVFSVRRPAVAH